jgi:glycerophosphoryl diester phosphodiesterase
MVVGRPRRDESNPHRSRSRHARHRGIATIRVIIASMIPPIVNTTAPTGLQRNPRPIVIGHRGASGYRPEHTLEAYRLAIELGADYVEPDLVSTSDGVLIARHENEIGGTTDVAAHPEFASRRTTKTVDGVAITGWFTEDFTLAEIKTLRARERLPQIRPQNTGYDGMFEIPALQEIIDLVRREENRRGGPIGIYPETKHPSYFDSIGLSLEEPLVATLERNGYRGARSPVFVQSFEVANLRELATMTSVRLVQLVNSKGRPFDFGLAGDPRTYADLGTPAGLGFIAGYARGVGVHKDLVISRDASGNLLGPTALVPDAHAAGLDVHGWTFRAENRYLPTDLRIGDRADPTYPARYGDFRAEYGAFHAAGLDGVFTDQPDLAVAAREASQA